MRLHEPGTFTEKDETPTAEQASGVSAEQGEMFDVPEFCPILPPKRSAAMQALIALLKSDLTQVDWLNEGNGWRLSAHIKDLNYLGWEVNSALVKCSSWQRHIARYSLPAKAKRAFYAMSSQEVTHAQ